MKDCHRATIRKSASEKCPIRQSLHEMDIIREEWNLTWELIEGQRMQLETRASSAALEITKLQLEGQIDDLKKAVNGLREEQRRIQAYQSEENKRLTSVLERVAYLEENMLTVMKAQLTNQASTQRRLDMLTGMLEVIGERTQQILSASDERERRPARLPESTMEVTPAPPISQNK